MIVIYTIKEVFTHFCVMVGISTLEMFKAIEAGNNIFDVNLHSADNHFSSPKFIVKNIISDHLNIFLLGYLGTFKIDS